MSNTNNESSTSKHPTHVAYHVRSGGEGKKGYWTPIGSVWTNADGKGFNIQLNGLVPLDGRITCRVPSDKKD